MSTIQHSSIEQTPHVRQRAGAAEILTQHRDEILRRIHAQIGGNTRKVTDTEDILSTVARRLDHLIAEGRLQATSERQLFALIHAITDRTLLEKHRQGTRTQQRESSIAREHEANTEHNAQTSGLERIVKLVPDPIDRQILNGKARGWSYETLAAELGIQEEAVRQRWSRLRKRVQESIRGT